MAATVTTTSVANSRFLSHLNGPRRPVLVFDGATGTSLQEMELTADAFGGPELKTAYITLSGKGELIAMDWPRGGLPLNFLNK